MLEQVQVAVKDAEVMVTVEVHKKETLVADKEKSNYKSGSTAKANNVVNEKIDNKVRRYPRLHLKQTI